MVRVGWATPGLSPMSLLGSDSTSYAIDGYHVSFYSILVQISLEDIGL